MEKKELYDEVTLDNFKLAAKSQTNNLGFLYSMPELKTFDFNTNCFTTEQVQCVPLRDKFGRRR